MIGVQITAVRRWWRSGAVLAAVGGLAMTGVAAAPAQATTDPLHRFEQQAIAWHDCRTNPHDPAAGQLAAVGAVCGELTVPLDYRHPDGRTMSVGVARRPATDTAHRLGTLVLGLFSRSGIAFPVNSAPAVAARYDLVSVDPRFFGPSAPVSCDWPVGLTTHLGDATPDRASFDALVAFTRQAASLCAKDADLLQFASSADMARDTDILRAALGEQRISYLAVDHDAYPAAVYVQLFGQHLDRMVLDGTPDPNDFGPLALRDNAPAAAAALAHWAAWAALRDPQYHLGTSTVSVLHTVEVINDAARRQPLRVGDFRVTAAMLPSLVTENKDANDAAYAVISDDVGIVRDAANGLTVTPSAELAAGLSGYSDPTVRVGHQDGNFAGHLCADRAAPRDPEFYRHDIQNHLATEPFYGPWFRAIDPCAFWPTNPIEPATTIRNHHPLLIVGGTGDSHLPYADQLAMHQALHGSRLVTLDGSFRHLQYLFAGNACVDNTVQNYLLGGPLPRHDVTCQLP